MTGLFEMQLSVINEQTAEMKVKYRSYYSE